MATHTIRTRGLLMRLVLIALAVSAVAFVGSRWTVSAAPLLQAVSQEVLDLGKEPNIRINGITLQDRSGGNLAVGDINNDGVDDLILGGHLADPIGRAQAGKTFVVFGPLETGTIELSEAVDITVNGVADFDHSGRAVASGDINNDGTADLIIGAFDADVRGAANVGTTYVLFGPLGAGQLELAVDPDIIVNGINAHDLSAAAVGSGDINNDGADDLIIGAPQTNTDEGHAGQTYVVFGPLEAGTLELSTSADLIVNGDLLNQNTGSTLAQRGRQQRRRGRPDHRRRQRQSRRRGKRRDHLRPLRAVGAGNARRARRRRRHLERHRSRRPVRYRLGRRRREQ